MMKRLVPEQRLLLILRNPVDRAYSEWQMKLRRVEAQLYPTDTSSIDIVSEFFWNCTGVAAPAAPQRAPPEDIEERMKGNDPNKPFNPEAHALDRAVLECVIDKTKNHADPKVHWLGYHGKQVIASPFLLMRAALVLQGGV
jgi:hypothetical protein